MPTFNPVQLSEFVAQIFVAVGAPAATATVVANSLVESDLVGHESHGVVRVRQYLDSIVRGDINPAAQPVISVDNGSVLIVDAQRSFGQLAASFTMEHATQRAKSHGLAAAGLINCGHVGRLGEWVQLAAAQDAIALAYCNGGGVQGIVAPFGGAARLLGTNPVAAAVPMGDHPPVVLDFATSAVAEGKVRVARNRGKSIPEGWILDADGLPSTDPNALYANGMLLPAATHKGYGLSLLVELLGGLLTGAGCPALGQDRPGNGVLFLVLDIAAFRPVADFLTESGALADKVKAVPPAPGFHEVLLPGEPEERSAAERRATGVTVDDATWTQLCTAAADFFVAVPVA
jgi:LDH2 family malate/lactate/ureidoglycolate dehydrogenase